jgi:hypothetical protein
MSMIAKAKCPEAIATRITDEKKAERIILVLFENIEPARMRPKEFSGMRSSHRRRSSFENGPFEFNTRMSEKTL